MAELPRERTLLKYSDSHRVDPSKTDVRKVLKIAGLSAAKAGAVVGLSTRTLQGYTLGEYVIPYAPWRMLLVYSRIVELPDRMKLPEAIPA